jgi:hypothetical protein
MMIDVSSRGLNADGSAGDPAPESPGVCFERSPSGSPRRLRTRAGERAHRRHERRSWLPEAEFKDQDGRRSSGSAVRLPKPLTLRPTAACARGAASRVHRPSCAAAAASPRAIARSRPRAPHAWDLRPRATAQCLALCVKWPNTISLVRAGVARRDCAGCFGGVAADSLATAKTLDFRPWDSLGDSMSAAHSRAGGGV